MRNRLKLDFTITTTQERKTFVEDYLQKDIFQKVPPTRRELETISNYILWGKDEDGKNSCQRKEIQLETRNGTWDEKPIESLDALREAPTFKETSIKDYVVPTQVRRRVFSREEARNRAPPAILTRLESLWREIDYVDLITDFYDLAHNRRTKPIRADLLSKFSQEEQDHIRAKADELQSYKYWKLRHLLVELRQEQYLLRDFYAPQHLSGESTHYSPPLEPNFGEEIAVLPLGIWNRGTLFDKVFRTDRNPNPSDFSEDELRQISEFLRADRKTDFAFDFRELEHVYQAILNLDQLRDSARERDIDSTLGLFVRTIDFYIATARLAPTHYDILQMKMAGRSNQEIASKINSKYGTTYNPNYISTIFRQKIITQINAAVCQHLEIVENLFFPENFKQCNSCGEVLLINSYNFVRRAVSKDGFTSRCKRCDKKRRQKQ